jgi:hypothetical protein
MGVLGADFGFAVGFAVGFVLRFPAAAVAGFFSEVSVSYFAFVAGEAASDVSGAAAEAGASLPFSAAASFSLGDSSSTIICQRISGRIHSSVHKSSKKVNIIQFYSIFVVSQSS